MVGDTMEADCDGPIKFGMHGFYLARNGERLVQQSLTKIDEILPILGLSLLDKPIGST
jgi:FMN phosphatase YigB (HAD superfamily)